jgi:hypothetical protein
MKRTVLKLCEIRIDGGMQPRAELSEAAVAEYAEAMEDGAKLPPVTVFFDRASYWLGDGYHRYHAHRQIGRMEIEVDLHEGSRRDAILHAVGANAAHGLRRTNADKRRSVALLLDDDEWSKWSDNEIAKRCAVSQPFVGSARSSLITVGSEKPAERAYTTKHGTSTTMRISSIGKPARPAKDTAVPAVVAASEADTNDAQIDDDAFCDFDSAVELETAQKEIDALREQITALSSSDVAAKLAKEIRTRQGIEARLAQTLDKVNQQDTELRRFGNLAKELRDLLCVETNSRIIGAVRASLTAMKGKVA